MNLASVARGTYALSDRDEYSHSAEKALTENNVDVNVYCDIPENAFFFVHFASVVTLDTLVVRLYDKDERTYTFRQFESSPDGTNWAEILPPGSTRKGSFKVTFPPRSVSCIRIRAVNSVNPNLHIVRFQAFNFVQ